MADLRKPVFFSTATSVAGCTKIADGLFQYDEVGPAPTEIINGLGVMPPEESVGKYQIWSDTYTLGMTDAVSARPVFYAADIDDLNDILVGVNTIASRLGLARYTDPNDGRTWLEGISEVYVHAVDALPADPNVCDPNVLNAFSGGSGPGNVAGLYQVNRFVTKINDGNAYEFDTLIGTKTRACTLEYLEERYTGGYAAAVGGTHWGDWSNNTAIYTTNTGWNALPVVGDVIYRDNTGSDYFGAGGFLWQNTSYQMNTDSRAFNWITVGANGVVTNVEELNF
jgi:hypothetical protein